MQEGEGNDHLAIAWEYPDQPLEVIPANFSLVELTCAMDPYCGAILDTWTGISGSLIDDLRVGTNNLTSEPNQSRRLTNLLESPTNIEDNYGSRMKGWLVAPVTGSYSFWIASDDQGEFWLSTDSDPANMVLACWLGGAVSQYFFNAYPEQKSEPIALVAGRAIYYEVRQGLILISFCVWMFLANN